jgi:MbtH protein
MTAEEGSEIFVVVVNDEEQYSLWPEYKVVPAGWRQVGEAGSKEVCLEYIKTFWTDMRPLSLRRKMEVREQIADSSGH